MRRRVAAGGAVIEAGDVIDDELSRAVVAYVRGAGLAWPHRSLDAVAGAMDADAAERLGPHLKRLADETVYWPVDWNRHDLLSAMDVVLEGARGTSPRAERRGGGGAGLGVLLRALVVGGRVPGNARTGRGGIRRPATRHPAWGYGRMRCAGACGMEHRRCL